jgi:hypothetical protein
MVDEEKQPKNQININPFNLDKLDKVLKNDEGSAARGKTH